MTRLLNWLCFRWPFYHIPVLGRRRDSIKKFIWGQFAKAVYSPDAEGAGDLYDTITYKESGEIPTTKETTFIWPKN